MSGSCLVSLILQFLHLLFISFRLSCFSSDTLYFSMSAFQASCEFSLHFLANPKDIYVKADYMEISSLSASFVSLQLVCIIFCIFCIGALHLFCEILQDPFVSCNCFGFIFTLIKLFIIYAELDVSYGSSHLISLFFDDLYHLILCSLPYRG